jgi:hypothetical protein
MDCIRWRAFLMIVSTAPEKVQALRRYRGEGTADIVIAMMLQTTLNVAGALASAWAGYGFRQYLMFFASRN